MEPEVEDMKNATLGLLAAMADELANGEQGDKMIRDFCRILSKIRAGLKAEDFRNEEITAILVGIAGKKS